MTVENKVFDDYEVDCNTCEAYWDNQCDGVKVGTTRNCSSYKATRKIDVFDILLEHTTKIKSLEATQFVILGILLFYMVKQIIC